MKEGKADMARRLPNPVKERPEEDELIGMIDAHLLERNKPYFKRKSGFSPSDTNDCARRMFYLLNGIEITPTHDARTHRIFDNGHGVHERLQNYFAEMGILIDAEKEVSYPPYIGKAFIDLIIDWHGKSILELKSIGEEGFAFRKQFNKPKDDHVQQVRIYGRIEQCDRLFIVYENKNTQELLVFKVEQDDDALNKLFKKWEKTLKMVEADTKPKRPVKSPESKKCTFCEVKDLCWSDPDAGQ